MAEGGPDHEHVDQLLTPVSAMHISPSASRRFRVNKATVSPTGGTPVSKRVSARTQFSSRKRLSFSPVPTEAIVAVPHRWQDRGRTPRRRRCSSFFCFTGVQRRLGAGGIVIETSGDLLLGLCKPDQRRSSPEQV